MSKQSRSPAAAPWCKKSRVHQERAERALMPAAEKCKLQESRKLAAAASAKRKAAASAEAVVAARKAEEAAAAAAAQQRRLRAEEERQKLAAARAAGIERQRLLGRPTIYFPNGMTGFYDPDPDIDRLFVKCFWGSNTHILCFLDCMDDDTIKTLKAKIQDKEGIRRCRIPIDDMLLIYNGVRLKDDRTLNSYWIHGDCMLHAFFLIACSCCRGVQSGGDAEQSSVNGS